MDYTPISARRVLLAFAFTAFVALAPALFFFLQSGASAPLDRVTNADGGYRELVLGTGSAVLTASLIGVLMLTVALGRRMVRRPTRA
ncbi:hypothetical protein [Aeromicrobium sp. NPDC092404]|uniref:hypothetical protein n=1 Tax=Aeromicrobium sp. NPDC092404 TaxID=3154976 RepID=UPI0034151AAB